MSLASTLNAILVIPRGEVYFDRFLDGTLDGEGEMYLGNTPGFTVSRSFEETKRFSSYKGQIVERDAIVTQEKNTATVTTDNVSMDNVSLWFGGAVNEAGQAGIGFITEVKRVKRGRWYQLGTTMNLAGVRHVEPEITLSTPTNGQIPVAGNITVNRPLGRFYVLDDAADLDDGEDLSITFQWRQASGAFVVPSGKEVVGALRFVATNHFGPQISYLFPYVRLKPKGDLNLKDDNFQTFQFDIDIRKKGGTADYYYVTAIGDPTYNFEELYIMNVANLTLERFVEREGQFNTILNVSIPEANYG